MRQEGLVFQRSIVPLCDGTSCLALDKAIRPDAYYAADDVTRAVVVRSTESMLAVCED